MSILTLPSSNPYVREGEHVFYTVSYDFPIIVTVRLSVEPERLFRVEPVVFYCNPGPGQRRLKLIGGSRSAGLIQEGFIIHDCSDKQKHLEQCRLKVSLLARSGSILFAFGSNFWGELGTKRTGIVSVPTLVKFPRSTGAIEEGKVALRQIACGSRHSMFLTLNGGLFASGDGLAGQLGLGKDTTQTTTPVQWRSRCLVEMVACGSEHTAIISDRGALMTFGCNEHGQLGHGACGGTIWVPRAVKGLGKAKKVSCGSCHTVALTAEGALFTWGQGKTGALGLVVGDLAGLQAGVLPPRARDGDVVGDVFLPCQVPGAVAISDIAAGSLFSLFINENGIFSSGWKESRCLGRSTKEIPSFKFGRVRTRVGAFSKVIAGTNSAMAIADSGKLYGWGSNERGQLGLGDRANRACPTLIEALVGWRITDISLGWQHAVAVSLCGCVWTWGAADQGNLGVGGIPAGCPMWRLPKSITRKISDHGDSVLVSDQLLPRLLYALCGTGASVVAAGQGQCFVCTSFDYEAESRSEAGNPIAEGERRRDVLGACRAYLSSIRSLSSRVERRGREDRAGGLSVVDRVKFTKKLVWACRYRLKQASQLSALDSKRCEKVLSLVLSKQTPGKTTPKKKTKKTRPRKPITAATRPATGRLSTRPLWFPSSPRNDTVLHSARDRLKSQERKRGSARPAWQPSVPSTDAGVAVNIAILRDLTPVPPPTGGPKKTRVRAFKIG